LDGNLWFLPGVGIHPDLFFVGSYSTPGQMNPRTYNQKRQALAAEIGQANRHLVAATNLLETLEKQPEYQVILTMRPTSEVGSFLDLLIHSINPKQQVSAVLPSLGLILNDRSVLKLLINELIKSFQNRISTLELELINLSK
jgi:hypothetical protein